MGHRADADDGPWTKTVRVIWLLIGRRWAPATGRGTGVLLLRRGAFRACTRITPELAPGGSSRGVHPVGYFGILGRRPESTVSLHEGPAARLGPKDVSSDQSIRKRRRGRVADEEPSSDHRAGARTGRGRVSSRGAAFGSSGGRPAAAARWPRTHKAAHLEKRLRARARPTRRRRSAATRRGPRAAATSPWCRGRRRRRRLRTAPFLCSTSRRTRRS